MRSDPHAVTMLRTDCGGHGAMATRALPKNEVASRPYASHRVSIKTWAATTTTTTTLAFHFLVTLTVTVVCANLAMNIFLIRVLQLTRSGMSSVKFSTSSGIWLRDHAVFADLLRTTRLSHFNYNKEQTHEGLLMSSGKDVHIESNNRAGRVNSLTLSSGRLEARGETFEVVGSRPDQESVLFRADRDEMVVAADEVPIAAPNGFILRGSLQANTVRGSPRHDLRLESPLNEVNIASGGDLLIESKTEHINIRAVNSVDVQSHDGMIVVSSHRLEIKDLPIVAMRSVRVRRDASASQSPGSNAAKSSTNRDVGDAELNHPDGSSEEDDNDADGDDDDDENGENNHDENDGSQNGHVVTGDSSELDESDGESYTLCTCKNGKLFVVGPDDNCRASLAFCNDNLLGNSNNSE